MESYRNLQKHSGQNRRQQRSKSQSHHKGRRPIFESLEDRRLLAVLSIADASLSEQGNLSTFVAGNNTVNPVGIAFGPDLNDDSVQDLYVVSGGAFGTNSVVVYDGNTGLLVEEYVSAESGLYQPGWLTFDAQGNLYTSIAPSTGGARNAIMRVDHLSRAVTTFVPSNASGGLQNAKGLTFGPDGNLYVACANSNQVFRYNGVTGQFIDVYVAASNGLNEPSDVVFGPDRNSDLIPDLYVSNNRGDNVLIFDGQTPNTDLGTLVSPGNGDGKWGPHDMQFGPDGNLYVAFSSNTTNFDMVEQVYRFDGTTGALIDRPVAVGSGLSGATTFLAINNHGELFVSEQVTGGVLQYNRGPVVTLATASSIPVSVDFSTTGGSATQGVDFASVSGRLTFAPGETSKRILVTAKEDITSEPNEKFTVSLSNAVGATITDAQADVTILNSQTKFFVVDDRPRFDARGRNVPDATYKYDSSGASIVANDLYFTAFNVRGVASNADGTRLWTLDANGTVWVSDNRNLYLGSWAAGGLSQPEGITTNGTDIWIVDAGSDKIFKFNGAASRLSGSQNSNSSFKLSVKGSANNSNPKDVVTDGNHLWVVNDASTDKVFKYNTSGAYVGNWTISTSGASSPTGITLDPSNASQSLWIVDNTSDRVYEYANGRNQPNNVNVSASSSWALAPGNTNPQGIADPPPSAFAPTSSQASDEDSSTQLPSTPSMSLHAVAGAPAIEFPRTAAEFERSQELLESLPDVVTTELLTTSGQFDLREWPAQPSRSERSATGEADSSPAAEADLAFADGSVDWLDEALVELLGQAH